MDGYQHFGEHTNSCRMYVPICQTTRCHNPEDQNMGIIHFYYLCLSGDIPVIHDCDERGEQAYQLPFHQAGCLKVSVVMCFGDVKFKSLPKQCLSSLGFL
jgi:hypothetical protein